MCQAVGPEGKSWAQGWAGVNSEADSILPGSPEKMTGYPLLSYTTRLHRPLEAKGCPQELLWHPSVLGQLGGQSQPGYGGLPQLPLLAASSTSGLSHGGAAGGPKCCRM